MIRFRPTSTDIAAIREAARQEAKFERVGQVILEVGRRQSLASGETSINFALISDDPDWQDTDLDDYEPWAAFTRGVDLTAEGRGLLDFYIRRRGDRHLDLHGNVSIGIVEGKLTTISGYPTNYRGNGS